MTEHLTRRGLILATTAAATAAVDGCSTGAPTTTGTSIAVSPTGRAVAQVEGRRATTGRTVTVDLTAQQVTADLAGREVSTWAYQQMLAGPAIRVRRGDHLNVLLHNELPDPTSVHWHGLALRNDMDGVPDVTQKAVGPTQTFRYGFVVPDAGTYWFHSHVGTQLDRGLYGPLVVEDPEDAGVDVDEVLVFDDWLDGISGTPDAQLSTLRQGMSMSGMAGMGSAATSTATSAATAAGGASGMAQTMTSALLGGDAGDITYPLYLVNGRPPADRRTLTTPAGGKVRLRLINAGSDTAFRVAVGGHRLTVTHTDGRPVLPVTVDTVLLGMGERYDVEFVAASGVWPIYAAAEGKSGAAVALLRTTDAPVSRAPSAAAAPRELTGQLLHYSQLVPSAAQKLPVRAVDRRYTVDLVGNMQRYQWNLGGDATRLFIRSGERVRLIMRNKSPMWHPMHLHGHSFAVVDYSGVRKDTVNVLPKQTVTIDFDADNPGQWAYHCHNVYHQSLGMMTTVSYRQ